MEISKLYKVTVLYFDLESADSRRWIEVWNEKVSDNLTEVIVSIGRVRSVAGRIIQWFIVCSYYLKFIFRYRRRFFAIHLHAPYHIGVFLWPFLMIEKLPVFITEHWSGYFPEDGRFNRLVSPLKWMLRKLFIKAKAVNVISHSLKDSITKTINSKLRISIIPNVINCSVTWRPLKPEFEFKKQLLVIGNLNDSEKNISGIIEAFSRAKSHRSDLKLLIVGDGRDIDNLRNDASRLQLDESSIEFTGFVNSDKIEEFYRESVCYIMNSHFETFSISTVESLIHGVPVISTRCYGPEEYIDQSNGILIGRNNTDELCNAMLIMAENYRDYNPNKLSDDVKDKYCRDISVMFKDFYLADDEKIAN